MHALDVQHSEWDKLAIALCRPHLGVGADGLAAITHHGRGNFELLCLGADGSLTMPSGEEAACCAMTIKRSYGYRRSILHVDQQCYEALVKGDRVYLGFPVPSSIEGPKRVADEELYLIRDATDHAVLFVDNLERVDALLRGRALVRDAPASFAGSSVNFAQVRDGGRVRVRTYVGGEGETLCGGASKEQIEIDPWGGVPQVVTIEGGPFPRVKGLWLDTPVAHVFDGEIDDRQAPS